ncbi:hypothetical protein [Actinophytocola sp.]|uniref:hypothetical protein n=1 Tax=Actinophytocola sp. TaxID=1872138 RepID=UPI002D7E5ABA|nr:hypothetical protein [Actinophytocola sp.]HET9140567.1 hypothetical protein [Actinophytocola sp.]HEU5109557.1 hypothetical protein [Micromonosporaceae bacterium]
MFRRPGLAVVSAAALAFALSGCSDSNGSSSDGQAGGAVGWADRVCQAIGDDLTALQQRPDLTNTDPQKVRESLITYLSQLSSTLDGMVSGVKDAGPPPVTDGSAQVDKLTDLLGNAKTSLQEAKTALEQAQANDPQAYQAAVLKVTEEMSKFAELEDPFKELSQNKELSDAFEQAPECKKIDLGGSTSSAPTS